MPEGFLVMEALVQLAGEIAHAPSAEREHDDAQFAALVGEGVGGARWMIRIEVAAHQTVGFKRLQSIRKDIGRHPWKALLEILKTHGARKQVANDQKGPALTHDVERSGHGTGEVEIGLCHFGTRSSYNCESNQSVAFT